MFAGIRKVPRGVATRRPTPEGVIRIRIHGPNPSRRPVFRTILLLFVTASAQAQGGRARETSLLITDVSLVDGTGAPMRLHASVLVRGGRIAAVDTAGAPTPMADLVINGQGLCAIPGLIDGHVHIGTRPWEAEVDQLRRALQGGVTSVMDMAGDTRSTGALARAVLVGDVEGPSIYYVALVAGPAFFADPRAIGASRGYTAGTAPWMQSITSHSDIARAIAIAKGTGAIAIKAYADLDAATVRQVATAAHALGLKVVAHATTFPARPGELVAAGVDVLAHTPYLVWEGSPPTSDFPSRAHGDFLHVPAGGPVIGRLLDAMRDAHVALNPTLWVFAESAPSDSLAAVRTPWMDTVTHRASDDGVLIMAGTDGLFGIQRDPLPTLHRELELLVTQAGLSPLQAISAGTGNVARAMGFDGERGTIEPGKWANIVLLDANPLENIRNTRRIRYVIKSGQIVRGP